jgi:hypothetical protein
LTITTPGVDPTVKEFDVFTISEKLRIKAFLTVMRDMTEHLTQALIKPLVKERPLITLRNEADQMIRKVGFVLCGAPRSRRKLPGDKRLCHVGSPILLAYYITKATSMSIDLFTSVADDYGFAAQSRDHSTKLGEFPLLQTSEIPERLAHFVRSMAAEHRFTFPGRHHPGAPTRTF